MKTPPGPPRLPKEEQEEFETLIQKANTQMTIEDYNEKLGYTEDSADAPPKVDVGSFSPEAFKIIPEFEGDTNPKTGEVNGPKQDPLRHKADWSFNGRVTDF
ncbi:unnamed protein product [Ambrosiozyma monospora]|uniref:Succinate dehydrogenase assembly factor 4, mitochondrial n=1 Tax=Ambrosiozyma monospora TaxID=43982 RepID=A0A9W6SWY6_AMBMO|nr:unnamed protein product [Ambrosiozyma monospora]